MLAFENNCFCFQVASLFTKKVKFIQNVYREGPLFDKKTYKWKTKAIVFKPNFTLMLLAKFEFDTWFKFFQKNKEISKNRISTKAWWRHRDVIKCAWMER